MKKTILGLLLCFLGLLFATHTSTAEVTNSTPSITILSPNGGESFVSGQDITTVSWIANGLNPEREYRVEITMVIPHSEWASGFYLTKPCYLQGTVTAPCRDVASSNGANKMAFMIPGMIYGVYSGNYSLEIRVIDWTSFLSGVGEGTVVVASDISDGLISISQPPVSSITVLSLNGGENLQVGSTNTISWSSVGLGATDRVWLELTKYLPDSGFWDYAESLSLEGHPATGSYAWTIPQRINAIPGFYQGDNYVAGAKYKIRIIGRSASGTLGPIGQSGVFTITAPLSLRNVRIWSPQGTGMMMTFEMDGAVFGKLYRLERSVDIKEWKFNGLFLAKGYNPGPQEMAPASFKDTVSEGSLSWFFRLVEE